MLTNKMLAIEELYFNLPDDFDGNFEDALELLAKYRRNNKESQIINYKNKSPLEAILDTNFKLKCACKYGINIYDKNKNEYIIKEDE